MHCGIVELREFIQNTKQNGTTLVPLIYVATLPVIRDCTEVTMSLTVL